MTSIFWPGPLAPAAATPPARAANEAGEAAPAPSPQDGASFATLVEARRRQPDIDPVAEDAVDGSMGGGLAGLPAPLVNPNQNAAGAPGEGQAATAPQGDSGVGNPLLDVQEGGLAAPAAGLPSALGWLPLIARGAASEVAVPATGATAESMQTDPAAASESGGAALAPALPGQGEPATEVASQGSTSAPPLPVAAARRTATLAAGAALVALGGEAGAGDAVTVDPAALPHVEPQPDAAPWEARSASSTGAAGLDTSHAPAPAATEQASGRAGAAIEVVPEVHFDGGRAAGPDAGLETTPQSGEVAPANADSIPEAERAAAAAAEGGSLEPDGALHLQRPAGGRVAARSEHRTTQVPASTARWTKARSAQLTAAAAPAEAAPAQSEATLRSADLATRLEQLQQESQTLSALLGDPGDERAGMLLATTPGARLLEPALPSALASTPAVLPALDPPAAAAAQTQVCHGLVRLVQTGRQSAEIELDPPELGRVRLRLELHDRTVTGTIEVERPSVLSALQADMHTLVGVLDKAGIQCKHLDIQLLDPRRGQERRESRRPGTRPEDETSDEQTPAPATPALRPRPGTGLVDYWL